MEDLLPISLVAATLTATLIGIPVSVFAGFSLGRVKGYREGKTINAPMIRALGEDLKTERELTHALQEQIKAQERLISAQCRTERLLDEQIHLMVEARAAMESTIGTQRAHIELLESLPQ